MPELTTTRVRAPFDLELAVFGHGWISLAPHRWEDGRWHTTLTTPAGVVDLTTWQSGATLKIAVDADFVVDTDTRRFVRRSVRHMLRVDEDLTTFWRMCERTPRLRWVARRGAGRLMRSPTVFEDLMKLLFTTNCSWSATRSMTANLVDALGPASPSGRRAFPSAARCARRRADFFRDTVRAGYRARSCVELAHRSHAGLIDKTISDAAASDVATLRRQLMQLRGFGPYAAGQALRLLGRYDDLALDSWCRARLAQRSARGVAPSDATIERRYARFGRYKGLALWMDLTASWHDEGDAGRVSLLGEH